MAAHSRSTKRHLVYGENNLQQNKSYDDSLQAQRTFSVNNIRQSLSGIRDHGQFTGQEIGALLEFIFILEPGIEPLQVRPFPKYVWLFRHRNETGHSLLHQQRISNV